MYIYLSNFFNYFHVSISINFKYLIENFDSAADKLKKKKKAWIKQLVLVDSDK